MTLTRRQSLRLVGGGVAAGLLARSAAPGRVRAAGGAPKFKVGVTDWNLKLEGKPEAVALARQLGFDGVQVSIGKGTDRLPLSDPALQKTYLAESKRVGLPIAKRLILRAASTYRSSNVGERLPTVTLSKPWLRSSEGSSAATSTSSASRSRTAF